MTSDSQFNAIRPYIGEEIPAAVERLSQAEEFLTLFSQMTRVDKSKIRERQELPFRIQPPGHHFGLGHP